MKKLYGTSTPAPVATRNPWADRDLGKEIRYRLVTFDLGTARTDVEIDLPGTFIYVDTESEGLAYLRFNNKRNDKFPIRAGLTLNGYFDRCYLTNTAQAGKTLRVWYGMDASIAPPNQDISNITTVGTITNPLTPPDLGSGTHFSLSADATLKTLVAPAANVNGIDVIAASMDAWNTTGTRLMAHTSAPATWDDSAALTLLAVMSAGAGAAGSVLGAPVRVPAGYGLYLQSSNNTYQVHRAVTWEVL